MRRRDHSRLLGFLFGILIVLVGGAVSGAHPVPRQIHDRVIVVHLTPEAVVVDYHLEVDPSTAVVDVVAVEDRDELAKYIKPNEFYEAFTRCYAPILADNLNATLAGNSLTFTCGKRTFVVKDSVMCDFVFRAPWQPPHDRQQTFTFREGNYEVEAGQIQVSLTADPGVQLLSKDEPTEALKTRPAIDLRPGDDARLRKATANFLIPASAAEAVETTPSAPAIPDAEKTDAGDRQGVLMGLLLNTEQGFVMLLLLAAGFGALHALTPGHGKTLVAAYLVGERGTGWHALVLGLTTTLTHTGAVLALAALLYFCPVLLGPVQAGLGLVSGLLIAGLGFWLLLRRLAGQADHLHLGGHGHHHHHGDADHFHDAHGHAHPLPSAGDRVGWWSIILLGVTGGIVPCVDAIVMLLLAIWTGRLPLALPLLLAFSGGLAAVLILIGLIVVWTKDVAEKRLGGSRRFQRVFQALPLVSAAVIICLGLWLCRESVAEPPPHHAASSGSH